MVVDVDVDDDADVVVAAAVDIASAVDVFKADAANGVITVQPITPSRKQLTHYNSTNSKENSRN